MNIAIYSRKSKYSEKGDSIDNQIQYCKEYAEIHLSHIPDKKYVIYEDEGFSAANTARPQFQKLLKDIKNHSVDMLMCYRLDRINRNVSDFSKTLDILEQHEVSFISATENFDTSTPMGKAMIYIASVFAQLERETTAERVRDNMLALSHTGRWLGGLAPLGYDSEVIPYLDENCKERQLYRLIPVETELTTVRLLFYKYMETKSLSQVETYCLVNHIKTQKNCDFTKSSIALILQNPTYCIADTDAYGYFHSLGCIMANDLKAYNGKQGILCYNRTKHLGGRKQKKRPSCEWVIAIGKHEGIINGRDYAHVQNQIKQNKSKGTPRTETSNIALLSGKIICSDCGSRLRIKNIQRKEKKIYFSYVCEMKVLSKGSRCRMHNIPGNRMDSGVLEIISGLLAAGDPDTNYIPYLKKKEHLILGTAHGRNKKLETLQKEEHDLNNTIRNLLSQMVQNPSHLTVKYVLPKLEELDKKLNCIQKEIESLSVTAAYNTLPAGTIDSLYRNLAYIPVLLQETGMIQKKLALDSLIEKIDWDGTDAYVTLKTQ